MSDSVSWATSESAAVGGYVPKRTERITSDLTDDVREALTAYFDKARPAIEFMEMLGTIANCTTVFPRASIADYAKRCINQLSVTDSVGNPTGPRVLVSGTDTAVANITGLGLIATDNNGRPLPFQLPPDADLALIPHANAGEPAFDLVHTHGHPAGGGAAGIAAVGAGNQIPEANINDLLELLEDLNIGINKTHAMQPAGSDIPIGTRTDQLINACDNLQNLPLTQAQLRPVIEGLVNVGVPLFHRLDPPLRNQQAVAGGLAVDTTNLLDTQGAAPLAAAVPRLSDFLFQVCRAAAAGHMAYDPTVANTQGSQIPANFSVDRMKQLFEEVVHRPGKGEKGELKEKKVILDMETENAENLLDTYAMLNKIETHILGPEDSKEDMKELLYALLCVLTPDDGAKFPAGEDPFTDKNRNLRNRVISGIKTLARAIDPDWKLKCDNKGKDSYDREEEYRRLENVRTKSVVEFAQMRVKRREQMFKVLNLFVDYFTKGHLGHQREPTLSDVSVTPVSARGGGGADNNAAAALRNIAKNLMSQTY